MKKLITLFLLLSATCFAQKLDFKKQVTALPGMISIPYEAPTVGDSGKVQFQYALPVKAVKLKCSTDTGTVDINLEIRSDAAPNSAGTAMMSSSLTCSTTTGQTTTFSNSAISAGVPIAITIQSVTNATLVRIFFETQSTN